jgi:hypothetical protein
MQSMPTRHAKSYRKKGQGFLVEAAYLTEDNASEISNWAGGAQVVEEQIAHSDEKLEGLNVKTPEGTKRASVGMYVIKYGDDFYVSKAGAFEQNYEPVA